MLKLSEKQTLTVHNKMELGEDISVEAKGKGRKFVSRFIEPGVAHYEEFGDVLITKETLDGFINTMVGCPVIIQHKDIDDENVDKERVGVISNVWFNQFDGWYYCDGIIWDKQAIDLIKNQDWSVSCTYDFDSDKLEKTHNGKKIDMEFTGGEFLHLALVPNPRYERANIVMNAKEKDDDIEWITVHGNHIPIKKGQSKHEAVKEFINKQQDKSKDKSEDGEEKSSKVDFKVGDKVRLKEYPNKDYTITGYKNGRYLIGKGEFAADYSADDMIHSFKGIDKIKPNKYHSWDMQGAFTRLKENDELKKGYTYVYGEKLNYGDVEDAPFSEEEIDKLRKIGYINQKNEIEIPSFSEMKYTGDDSFDVAGIDFQLHFDKKEMFEKNRLTNNSLTEKEITMSVLNELESFIKGVIKNADDEDKKEEVKNEDKRKLIDEVGGILKGKVDDEVIKTIMKKMEEASYEPSEDKKADNEADEEEKEEKFEEEKKIANKCKNEEEKKEEDKKEEDKDEDDEVDKEEIENKCKNSMKDVKEIIMGGKSKIESDYISKADRFALGEKY